VTTFASDAFTNTAATLLQDHSANWTKHSSYTGNAQITDANRLRQSTSTTATYYHSGTPASADYSVTANLWVKGFGTTNNSIGVIGRVDTATDTHYWTRVVRITSGGSTRIQLWKVVNGTLTQLGGNVDQTWNDEEAHTLTLDMSGTTIRALVDGAQTHSSTDSAISAAGKAGIKAGAASSDTDGYHIDSWSADEAGGGGQPPRSIHQFQLRRA
jgi:hypothetical protein